ncbi:hypothetical protein BJX70DRAFT_217969 [Aspergillus crustosus]
MSVVRWWLAAIMRIGCIFGCQARLCNGWTGCSFHTHSKIHGSRSRLLFRHGSSQSRHDGQQVPIQVNTHLFT